MLYEALEIQCFSEVGLKLLISCVSKFITYWHTYSTNFHKEKNCQERKPTIKFIIDMCSSISLSFKKVIWDIL